MKASRISLRFIIAVLMLLATGAFLQARGRREILPSREHLAAFPLTFGPWTGRDVAISQDILDILGPGDFLVRLYRNQVKAEPYVDLFIAYFPSQRAGDTIHSPKHCLPGAGWLPVESKRIQIALPGHRPFNANRYIIAKGEDRQLVLYWYLAHDRALASEYWAKFYLVADSMRMNRSDGSLIRLTTPMFRDETPNAAERRLRAFAGQIVPRLDTYIPR
jgi:EpsI family protein